MIVVWKNVYNWLILTSPWSWHNGWKHRFFLHRFAQMWSDIYNVNPDKMDQLTLNVTPYSQRAHRVIYRIAHNKLTMWVANSQKAHSKLTVWVILWVHCEVTEGPQNDLSVSFNVNVQWVSCELKFFTGRLSNQQLKVHVLGVKYIF